MAEAREHDTVCKRVVAIIPAAGQGKRMGTSVSKSYMEILGRPLLAYTLDKFQSHSLISEIILVTQAKDLDYCQKEVVERYGFNKVTKIVAGGHERQDSVARGLAALEPDVQWVLIHDGARPLIDGQTISQAIDIAISKGAAVVGVPVKDTIKLVDELVVRNTPERHTLWAVQTPQVFRRDILEKAYHEAALQGWVGTDDASLVERAGNQVHMVRGDYCNIKVTTPEDLIYLQEKLEGAGMIRVGIGYDVHVLVDGRKLILGGIEIPHDKGLLGHSDADVLIHAIMDALLGAAGLGDIGGYFPDADIRYKDISSILLLKEVMKLLQEKGLRPCNIDCVIIAETPKMAPYREKIRKNLAQQLGVHIENVNIKATTTEGLGFTGRKEGIAAQAVCTLTKINL